MSIKYSIVKQNPSRPNCPWHGLIRQDGRKRYVPLHTTDKAEAERWLTEQRYKLDQFLAGRLPETEILSVDRTPIIAQKGPSGAVLTLGRVVEGWESKLRLGGQRESTIDTYTRAVRDIANMDMPVSEFSAAVIKNLLTSKAGCKPTTRRFYSNALKSLARYIEDDLGGVGLERAVPRVKAESPTKPFWTSGQMQKIIDAVKAQDPVMERQFKLYLGILANIGSRQGETAALTWEDFQVPDKLRFRAETTKGRKERIVPISRVLAGQLTNMRINNAPDPHSLIFDRIPKTQGSRDKLLRKAMAAVGITEGSLHCFRRSRSTALYRKHNDIKLVAGLLGHSPVTSLAAYQKARTVEELRELVEG